MRPRRTGEKAAITAHTGRLPDGRPLDGSTGTIREVDTDGTVWVRIDTADGGVSVPVLPDEVRPTPSR